MSFLRRNWRYFLAIGVTGISMIVFVILYILRKRSEVNKLKEDISILQAGTKVQGLIADKKARSVKLQFNAIEREILAKEIAKAKRNTVAVIREVENLSDIDIARAFKRMGY